MPGAMLLKPGLTIHDAGELLLSDTIPNERELISRAIDSAVSAGATYADARLTRNDSFEVVHTSPNPKQTMSFGVRALYQGYWGFAASPVWSLEEAGRLGLAAVEQAKVNVLGRERVTELAPIDISNGHWKTPIKDDPFNIDFDELLDFFGGISSFILTLKFVTTTNRRAEFFRINKAFGSSQGQFTSQVLYQSSGNISFLLTDKGSGRSSGRDVEEISIAGMGFEYFRDRPLREYIRNAHEDALHDLTLPVKPIEPGRFLTLIDQRGTANLLHQSIGKATEIDRVFGFESNSVGTSYINDPHVMLNTFRVGSSLMNVSCDRSEVGSVGRVKWDDEGVTPIKYDLVKDGVLVNLQTNREGASWIKDHYDNNHQLRSFGASHAPSGMDVQLVHQSDLSLIPSVRPLSHKDLRESIDEGIEFQVPRVELDFQQITGWTAGGRVYEIRKGKQVARLANAGMLFRTPELWSNLVQLGGHESMRYFGLHSKKGQPEQTAVSGVYSPPCVVKDITVIDITKKA